MNQQANRQQKSSTSRKGTLRGRRQLGQGLAESTAALVILLPIGMFLICGFVNVFGIMLFSSKLNFIAQEAVKYRQENIYWLGMRRQDPDGSLAKRADATAAQIAVLMAQAAGINLPPSNVVFTSNDVQGPNGPITLETCTLTPTGFKLPFAGIPGLPSFFNQSTSVTTAEAPVPPPCAALFDVSYVPGASDAGQLNNPKGANAGILLPCYGAAWNSQNTPGGIGAVQIPDMPEIPIVGDIQGLDSGEYLGVMSPNNYLRSPAAIAGLVH
jgi:hypothetical protein